MQSPPRANTTAEFQVSNQSKCTQYIHRWLKWVTCACPGAQCARRPTIPTTTMTPSREWCIPKRTSSGADSRTPANTSCSSKPSIRCVAVPHTRQKKGKCCFWRSLAKFWSKKCKNYRTTKKKGRSFIILSCNLCVRIFGLTLSGLFSILKAPVCGIWWYPVLLLMVDEYFSLV